MASQIKVSLFVLCLDQRMITSLRRNSNMDSEKVTNFSQATNISREIKTTPENKKQTDNSIYSFKYCMIINSIEFW